MTSTLRVALSTVLVVAIALYFGDRVGFEGDDLAIIAGAAHFDWRPLDSLYRYSWQPLSYALCRLLTGVGLAPLTATYLPNVLGGIGLVLLAESLRCVLANLRHRTAIAYGLVLSIPELWISVLYFNTTALGLPFFTGALLLLTTPTRLELARSPRLVSAAILFAIACVLRLDFAVASLALLLLVCWRAVDGIRAVITFMVVSGIAGCALLFALDVSPLEVLRGAGQLEDALWPAWRSLVVLVLSVLPLALLLPFLLWELRRRGWPPLAWPWWIAIVIAAIVMLYPLKSLYSGKYLLPAFCLALYGIAVLLRETPRGREGGDAPAGSNTLLPVTAWCSAGILLLLYGLGVQVDRQSRDVGVSWRAATFTTHDGPRPLAGYASMLLLMRDAEHRPVYILIYRRLAEWLERAAQDSVAVLVGEDAAGADVWSAPLINNWEWGWSALYLQSRGWSIESYSLREQITLKSSDGRRAQIVSWKAPAAAHLSGPCRITVGAVRFGEAGYPDMQLQSERLARAACRE